MQTFGLNLTFFSRFSPKVCIFRQNIRNVVTAIEELFELLKLSACDT